MPEINKKTRIGASPEFISPKLRTYAVLYNEQNDNYESVKVGPSFTVALFGPLVPC